MFIPTFGRHLLKFGLMLGQSRDDSANVGTTLDRPPLLSGLCSNYPISLFALPFAV